MKIKLAMKIGDCLSDEKYSQSTSRVEVENQNSVQRTKHTSGISETIVAIQNDCVDVGVWFDDLRVGGRHV